MLQGEEAARPREHLFVAIDDFSRELCAGIYPDKTQYSAVAFLQKVLEECPYPLEYSDSDNGQAYKGIDEHTL